MLEFFESFYGDTNLTQLGFGGSGHSVVAAVGRFGSAAMRTAFNGNRTMVLSGNIDTIIVNLAVNMSTLVNDTGGVSRIGFNFRDGSSSQLGVSLDALNRIVVGLGAYEGGIGTLLGTSTTALSTGAQYHIEVKVKIDSSVGTVEVWINGVLEINLTGQVTQVTGNAYANAIGFYQGNFGAGALDFSQIVVMNTSGGFMDDLLGDIRLLTDPPTGDSAQEDFSRSTGADSFALLDETPPNEDTDFIFSSNAGDATRLTFPALSVSPDVIHAVCTTARVRKTDAGVATYAHEAESNGTVDDGTTRSPSTSYLNTQQAWYEDPDTSSAWLEAAVNAATLGLKRIA